VCLDCGQSQGIWPVPQDAEVIFEPVRKRF